MYITDIGELIVLLPTDNPKPLVLPATFTSSPLELGFGNDMGDGVVGSFMGPNW